MKFFKAAILGATILASPLSPAFAQTIEDAIETSVSDLTGLSGEDFIFEAEYILYKWDELEGSMSDYFDAADIVVDEIDRFMEDAGISQDELHVPVNALQMIALKISGKTAVSGLDFSQEAALALYESGLVTSRSGPPVSYRGEYQSILKRLYMDEWGVTSLDGLVGEEAPSAYAKMLFDVYDEPTLCEAGEAVFWSCADPARQRYLSVCGSPTSNRETSWVQYRVGVPGDLELAYPEGKEPNFASEEAMMAGDGSFSREIWRYGGSTLNFTNGAYEYAIEDETFTDNAIVTARRGDETVFDLTCKTTHPFMDTIGGHLWGGKNDDALHIVPGAVDPGAPTACPAVTEPIWSCRDEDERETLSLCVSDSEGGLAVQYFTQYDGEGSVVRTPEEPVLLTDETVSAYQSEGADVLGLTIGNEEFYFMADRETTDGNLTYWRGGTPRFTQSCTVQMSELDALANGTYGETESMDAPAFTYDPQPILYEDLSPSPDAFDATITLLKGLESAGHFEAGAGMAPLDVLGGQAAIPFAMSLMDEEFRCQADHGGICITTDETYSVGAFFIGFRGDTGVDWFSTESRDMIAAGGVDPNDVSLSFEALSPPGTPITGDETGFCQARAYFEDWEAGTNMYQSIADQLNFEETPQYEWLWSSFRGVVSRYNVRAEPSASADIVGHAENEAIHFPEIDAVIEAEGYSWRGVVLPDGTSGYIAVSDTDLLKIDEGGQVCARMEGSDVKLTSIAIGGE